MPLAPVALALVLAVFAQEPSPSAECASLADCRDAALAAEAARDFEAFHSLAWRAVQKGPRNNPELMLTLARAQSSSGRPLDAIVMLRRLLDMGMTVDATGDGFERVRALPVWEDLERQLAAGGTPLAASTIEPDATPAPARAPAPPPSAGEPAREDIRPAPAATSAPVTDGSEALRFTTPIFTPAGLAYDAVSRRFIVGDRHARKLTVVDEFSHQIANLAGSQATGFGEIAALEIDPREGNLWVVTADEPGSTAGRTTLHKLQLISARALTAFTLPEDAGAARLTDVAVTAEGTVLAVDDAGRRLFRLRPRGQRLELAAALGDVTPVSIAPAPADVVYVTHQGGILRVDLATRAVTAVEAAPNLSLEGLARIRWHGRALVAIQATPAGGHRAVRLKFGRDGRRVTAIEVLDPSIDAASPAAACVSGDGLFYLAAGADSEMVVRRVELK